MILSIRTKIVIGQTVLIILVSAFIYSYYPEQQKQAALRAIDGKIQSISNMFSIGVGIGMGETDFVAVGEAMNWVENDTAVVYISVVTNADHSLAAFNPLNISVPQAILKEENKNSFVEDKHQTIFYRTDITYQKTLFGTLTIGYSLQPLHDQLENLRETTLYFCLAFFVLSTVFSIIIANRITKNITKLDATVKAIAEGNETVRVHVASRDEIGNLGNAFNQMLDNLQSSKADLVAYSNELKKHNAELNQFSYLVSHDLKAPLRAIFKLSEWIEEDLGSDLPGETKKHLHTLKGRVSRMEALINGLLEYSKIGRHNFQCEQTDTQRMLNEIADGLNPSDKAAIRIASNMPLFKTKRLLLYQVFSNLLSNALKHNDKNDPWVKVHVEEKNNFYQFTVSDNGVGIDERYHEKIFTMFQTLEARDKVEGMGVGLSIAKKSIEDVGGTIRVESLVGIGSKFIFTWPKKIAEQKKVQFI
jgi:signal transduction histidine kinase